MIVAETITCTECGAKLKVAALPAPGRKIRCPKCQASFTPELPDEDDDEKERDEARPAARSRRQRDEDDDDRGEAPRRRSSRSRHAFEFDGSAGDFFVVYLLTGVLTAITFGLAFPWTICMFERWKTEHTLINGRRLRFEGAGGDLFVLFIVTYFFIFITFGIYMFWAAPKILRWIAEHTDFED